MTEPKPTCSLCGCHDDRDALIAENEQLQEDVRLAADELMVNMAEAAPGTTVARLLSANRILSRRCDELAAKIAEWSDVTTLDLDERKSVVSVLKESLEREEELRAENERLRKDAQCPSEDLKTGLRCEDKLNHGCELHSNGSFAWGDETCGKQGCDKPSTGEVRGDLSYQACDEHKAEIEALVDGE